MFTEMPINDTFISALYKKKSDYNNPDQATTQEQSLIQLSSGIYTEEERFVFELFQNAVDAFENSTGCLNVKIAIQNGYLVFMHNGQAFSKRNIEGLCDVGNGNKTKDIKKIGYKGIGFKSVFWSSCVTVLSGGYCFKFDKEYWDDYWGKNWKKSYGSKDPEKRYLMPWQIIPIETTPPDVGIDTSDYTVVTYIRLGRKKNIGDKIKRLMSDCQFLLFVSAKNIKMSFWEAEKLTSSLEKKTIDDQVVLSRNGVEDSRWLIYSKDHVEVSPDIQEEMREDGYTPLKLQDAKSFDLSFAIRVDKDKRLMPMRDAVVYTYLPTSFKFGDEGLPFLVNANFITDAGRQQLHKDSAWNKLIFSRVPYEFLTWMSQISDKYPNYYEVLPKVSYGRSNPLETAYEEGMRTAIDTVAFIPSANDSAIKLFSHQAMMDIIGISEAISTGVLLRHVNKTYGKSFDDSSFIRRVWKGSRMLKDYGVFFFDKDCLAKLFEDKECFEGIDVGLDKKLVDFLFHYYLQQRDGAGKSDLMETLKPVKFLLDENEELAAPEDLYFPSDYREQNDMAENVIFLHPDIADSIKNDTAMDKWLADLGISELDDITFIKDVLCKDGYVKVENAIEVGRFLFKVNRHENIFDKIGSYTLSKIKILTKGGTLKIAEELYFGSYYHPEVDLESVYSGDIYVSEAYANGSNIQEWKVFWMRFGVNDTIELRQRKIEKHAEWSIIRQVKIAFEKLYYSDYAFHYLYSDIYYPPLLTPGVYQSHDLLKIIWSGVLKSKVTLDKDYAFGYSGYYIEYSQKRYFSELGSPSFIEWAIKNKQNFPAKDGTQHLSKDLFANIESVNSVGGNYLPIIDIDGEIDNSWDSLLNLKTQVGIDDMLLVLERIANDTNNVDENKQLITNIYSRIIEIGGIENAGYKDKLAKWATDHHILATDGKFYLPSELRYITLDGFGKRKGVYIGAVKDKDKVVDLLRLMGVKIITETSVKPSFKGREECDKIKDALESRISALALLKMGEDGDKDEYNKAKSNLRSKVAKTHFFQCDKIFLSYGDDEDQLEKETFGLEDNFYFTGNIRPANLEPLMEPLCSFLGIKKSCAHELFVVMIESQDGIESYLKEKGYHTELMEEEPSLPPVSTGVFTPTMPVVISPNAHTGFKGEILMYRYLQSQGYEPICPSIVTENDDYDFSLDYQGEKYYHKINYDKYDITFISKQGVKVYLEVKTTVCSKNSIENMPISAREWSMIDEVENSATEAYIIARIFSIDHQPEVYFLRGNVLKV
jgi:hypothetical protein